MKFNEKLNIITGLTGITQERLARRLGVSFATLNSWINGRSAPRPRLQARIDQLYQKETRVKSVDNPLEAKKAIIIDRARRYSSMINFILSNPDIRDQLFLSFTYNTNRIEGSSLTEQETATVLFDNVVLPNKSMIEQLEVKNHQAAFSYLLSDLARSSVIDEALILKLHGMLMNGIREDAGSYRQHAVRIVGANIPTANYLKVPLLMKELLPVVSRKREDLIRKIAVVHSAFEKIHPFSDGNGRIGRLMIQAMALSKNLPPAIIQQKRKRRYYAALNKAQRTEETGELEDFLCGAFLEGIRLLERR